MDVVTARRIGEEVPRVDALGAGLDLFDRDPLDLARGITAHQLGRALDGERPFEDAPAQARRVLDDLAHLAVPVRLHEAIVDLGLHARRRSGGLRLLLFDEAFERLLVVDAAHLVDQHLARGRAQVGQRGRLHFPGTVVRRQQHVGHARRGGIDVGARDVQEHDRARRALALFDAALDPALDVAGPVGRLVLTVGIVDALVVLFVFLPVELNAGRLAPADGLAALAQQGLQELIAQRVLRLLFFVVGHVSSRLQHLEAPSRRGWSTCRPGARWPCVSSLGRSAWR
ncbi:hypothetical protein D3C86_1163440 [compost metagenome]